MISDEQDELPAVPEGDRGIVSAWLREELGRPLTVVVVTPTASGWHESEFRSELDQTESVKYTVAQLDAAQRGDQSVAVFARFANLTPDILLAWCDQQPADSDWLRSVVRAADQVGLSDQCFMAVAGTAVEKGLARSLGFDNCFSPEEPFDEVFRTIAREGVTREVFRRRGASPPCYL